MGDITEKRMRHYIGADADKNTIPAAAKAFGDSYHANDKGKQYYWNGTAWKTGLGYEFVERLVNAHDKDEADFTTDGTYKVNGLDLSGIVPEGAVVVKLQVSILDDAADSQLVLRRDAAQGRNVIDLRTQVANIATTLTQDVSIDSDRLLDYMGSNLVFAAIRVTVIGWFI